VQKFKENINLQNTVIQKLTKGENIIFISYLSDILLPKIHVNIIIPDSS